MVGRRLSHPATLCFWRAAWTLCFKFTGFVALALVGTVQLS